MHAFIRLAVVQAFQTCSRYTRIVLKSPCQLIRNQRDSTRRHGLKLDRDRASALHGRDLVAGPNLKTLRLLQLLELPAVSLLDQAKGFLSLFDVLLDLSHLILEGLHSLLLIALGSINGGVLRATFFDLLSVGLQVELFGQLGSTYTMVTIVVV